MDAESLQIESDRNNLIFTLLIVATLMMLCSFLFAFFVLDNFQNVPCDVNRGLGPRGPPGIRGKDSKDNLKTGADGLPAAAGFVRGEKGEPGEEIVGPTGRQLITAGTGWPGGIGDTGPTGQPNLDGLTEPYLLFSGAFQTPLEFYSETEMIVQARALTFTDKVVDVRVVLIRMGSIVTLNIYPFLIYKRDDAEGVQGVIALSLFRPLLELPEYSPPRKMVLPCIVSKFSVTQTDGSKNVQEATQTNVDWGAALEILPGIGCILYANWSVYSPVDGSPTVPLLFQSAESPFGLEGIISAQWLID